MGISSAYEHSPRRSYPAARRAQGPTCYCGWRRNQGRPGATCPRCSEWADPFQSIERPVTFTFAPSADSAPPLPLARLCWEGKVFQALSEVCILSSSCVTIDVYCNQCDYPLVVVRSMQLPHQHKQHCSRTRLLAFASTLKQHCSRLRIPASMGARFASGWLSARRDNYQVLMYSSIELISLRTS